MRRVDTRSNECSMRRVDTSSILRDCEIIRYNFESVKRLGLFQIDYSKNDCAKIYVEAPMLLSQSHCCISSEFLLHRQYKVFFKSWASFFFNRQNSLKVSPFVYFLNILRYHKDILLSTLIRSFLHSQVSGLNISFQ